VQGSEELVDELVSKSENCWGSVLVSRCYYKLVAEARVSSGTQSKGNFRRYLATTEGTAY
jgi:hypothetical protein